MSPFYGGLLIGLLLGGFVGIAIMCMFQINREPEQDNNTICFDVGCGHRRRG